MQPGSCGKSIKPSPSLSIPSEHTFAGVGVAVKVDVGVGGSGVNVAVAVGGSGVGVALHITANVAVLLFVCGFGFITLRFAVVAICEAHGACGSRRQLTRISLICQSYTSA